MSDNPINIENAVDLIMSDGIAVVSVGGVNFDVRFQDDSPAESTAAYNVIQTLANLANSSIAMEEFQASSIQNVTVNIVPLQQP